MKSELQQLIARKRYDVVLVRPPHGRKPQFDFFPDEHLGLTSLKAYIEQHGYSSLVIDCHYLRIDEATLIPYLLNMEIKILGFTVFQPDMSMVITLAKKLRKSGFKGHITIGGQFPSFEYERILTEFKEIDTVIRSEGEQALVSLLEHLTGEIPINQVMNLVYRSASGIVSNGLNPLLELDSLPVPSREHISESPSLGIISSKGCYQNCSYCGVKKFYSEPEGLSLRYRSIPDLLDEIEFLNRKFHKQMFVFWDDNFLPPGRQGLKRMDEFCAEIQKRKLKIFFGFETRSDTINRDIIRKLSQVGLKYVFLGIESGSQQSLDTFNKQVTVQQNWDALSILSEEKVTALCAFIMYEPYSNVEKIIQNIEFLKKVFSQLNRVVYYPFSFTRLDILKGSPIHARLLKEKRIIDRPLKDFIVEGDVYIIEDPRIEDLSRITFELDKNIREYRLTLWRFVSWFAGLGAISSTRTFADMSKNFESLLWKQNYEAIHYSIKYLEDGLNFVLAKNYQKKMDSYIQGEIKRLEKFLQKAEKRLQTLIQKY